VNPEQQVTKKGKSDKKRANSLGFSMGLSGLFDQIVPTSWSKIIPIQRIPTHVFQMFDYFFRYRTEYGI
jgi:hypothetical protein